MEIRVNLFVCCCLCSFLASLATLGNAANPVTLQFYLLQVQQWSSGNLAAKLRATVAAGLQSHCAAQPPACGANASTDVRNFTQSDVTLAAAANVNSRYMSVQLSVSYAIDGGHIYNLSAATAAAVVEAQRESIGISVGYHLVYIGSSFYSVPPPTVLNSVIVAVAVAATASLVAAALLLRHLHVFKSSLVEDTLSRISGPQRALLSSLMEITRPEGALFDQAKVAEDATQLIEEGVQNWASEDSLLLQLLRSRSNLQLREIFTECERLLQQQLQDAVRQQLQGAEQHRLRTMLLCFRKRPIYFARSLHRATAASDVDHRTLLRIVINRCEVDMLQIKRAFQSEFAQSLGDRIRGCTAGAYCDALLLLTDECDTAADVAD